MWMNETDNVSFTWIDGYIYNIKDMKEYPAYDSFVKLKLNQNENLDEIASRNDVYGADAESYAYLIFECNREKIVENNFDLNKLHEIKIPVVT